MERFNPDLALTSTEAAELLDVHPSTVKRLCNRGEMRFERTAGGHRRLHLEDVLEFAMERGIPTVLTPFHPYEPHVWSAFQAIRREGSFGRLHSLAMGWVARGQLRRLGLLYEVLGRDIGIRHAFLDEGVRGLMRRVGDAWSQGRLRVGDEHLVSQVMTEVLFGLRARVERTRGSTIGAWAPTAVVGSMEGNQHHLGALCVRLTLEWAGWDVHYLGPDVPLEDFAEVQRGRQANLVAVSLAPSATAGDVARAIRVLAGLYDRRHPYALAFGGRLNGEVPPHRLRGPFARLGFCESCGAMSEWLEADSSWPGAVGVA